MNIQFSGLYKATWDNGVDKPKVIDALKQQGAYVVEDSIDMDSLTFAIDDAKGDDATSAKKSAEKLALQEERLDNKTSKNADVLMCLSNLRSLAFLFLRSAVHAYRFERNIDGEMHFVQEGVGVKQRV